MDTDLSKYIYKTMLEKSTHYQWRIVIDSSKRALEIYFTVSLDIPPEQYVQDVNARVNESEQLNFEDVVCFYDEANNKIVPSNYLIAVPINLKEGVEEGYVDAFIKQLNIVASSAVGQIREYLADESRSEFSLIWNEQNMKNTVQTMRKTSNYSSNKLTLVTEEEESLVEQFKEDEDDGMERV
ncbi:DUF3013 family protein [Carnobacteriaceae bacterium 52-44]